MEGDEKKCQEVHVVHTFILSVESSDAGSQPKTVTIPLPSQMLPELLSSSSSLVLGVNVLCLCYSFI